ncbi:hypothetical protein K1719_011184 [Acacia pycnantha]|nr:hypothetical protein K1719_011184 [Acacia pycnantha]
MFRSTYLDDGDACHECQVCGAEMWFAERLKGVKKNEMPQFGICCCNGKIIVPLLRRPPKELEELFFNKHSMQSKFFLKNIRTYNNMFCFTSMGGRIDHSINSRGGGPYSFVLSVKTTTSLEVYYPSGNPPFMPNSYIYDTENEISNRMSMARSELNQPLCWCCKFGSQHCRNFERMPGQAQLCGQKLRKSREIIKENVIHDVSIRLFRSSNSIGLSKQYSMPTTSELAALIVGDFDNSYTKRDIIVKQQCGKLQRIDELHMAYLPLQDPLLFPYEDNGYDSSNQHALESLSATKKKKKLTPREYRH